MMLDEHFPRYLVSKRGVVFSHGESQDPKMTMLRVEIRDDFLKDLY